MLPKSIMNVKAFLSCLLFISESLNIISAAGKYPFASVSLSDDSDFCTSSVEKKVTGSTFCSKSPIGSLKSWNSFGPR